MSLKLELPWPAKVLHPNARVHWAKRAKAAKLARGYAWATTMNALGLVVRRFDETRRYPISLTFCPPDRRRRDMDGMLSAMKSSLDGIADAMQVNDHLFNPSLALSEPIKGGKVLIEVSL